MKASFLMIWMLVAAVQCVYAEDPVHIADATLKAAIEDELWVYDPTPTDMLDLVKLTSYQSFSTQTEGISDVTGLEYAANLLLLNLRLNMIHDVTPLATLAGLGDLNLSQNRLSDISPLSQMTRLRKLNLHANKISDLSPLRNLSHIGWLDLHQNQLEDLSPLGNLTKLTDLLLFLNQITDISPLSTLTRLQTLDLDFNQVTDLSPLENMSQLVSLSLYWNRVEDISICKSLPSLRVLNVARNGLEDISPLAFSPLLEDLSLGKNAIRDISALTGLEKLHRLDLTENPLGEQAYRVSLEAIARANPGISLRYDPCTRPPNHLFVTKGLCDDRVLITWRTVWNGPQYTSWYRVFRSTSHEGTRVSISPWQTDTTFVDVTVEPGQQYSYWVQTALSRDGDEAGDYSAPDTGWPRAGVRAQDVFYVDADAAADTNQTGSVSFPFDSIQAAIDTASEGDRIVVRPGHYFETISFLGKNLTVTGLDPCEPDPVGFPVITGNDQDAAVNFTQGEDPNCTLEGFVISGGHGAILCQGSSPTIQHCLIVGNQSFDPNRTAIACWESQAWFRHCTIAHNLNSALLLHDSDVLVTNSILWRNQPEEILIEGTSEPLLMYTNTTHPWEGLGNISEDPQFVRPGHWESDAHVVWIEGDYHLQSAAGRWDPETVLWPADSTTSPCIDAADPDASWIRESEPHGSLANMGAYGNTSQASRSD